MARIVHCLMATSFIVLVMISSNSPFCQACIGPCIGRPRQNCLQAPNNNCTIGGTICIDACILRGYGSINAYCKRPKRFDNPPIYKCCCPDGIRLV
ncbi:unnamed protein product [Urochloa decumbens]|uniref:Uncharacterized protein n=1 Tax=Urochloa decumbens TaxID=240449 RepID=A0ABC9APS9_9POAL